MKQWIFKIDTRWGKKGELVPSIMMGGGINLGMPLQYVIRPEFYPEMFEKVETKTDEELLTDFIKHLFHKSVNGVEVVAAFLLSQNAINPEFLKSLREKDGER